MVKLGVIGSGRLARTVTDMALEQGHEVVTMTPELLDYEEELKAFPNLTVVEGAAIHDGDVSRLLDGGLESHEGSIKRTVSGSYGFSVKKMLSGMSQRSGVTTRCSHFTSESGSISRVPSGLSSVSGGAHSSLPARMSSGLSSTSSLDGDEMDELDVMLAMLELQNARKENKVLSPGALAMARHYGKYGMPQSMNTQKMNWFDMENQADDETPASHMSNFDAKTKKSRFTEAPEEVALFDVAEIQACDSIIVAMTDEWGYNTGTWSAHAVENVLKKSTDKKIFVVTRNAPARSGIMRKISDTIDNAEFPNPSGWGKVSTTHDQTKTEELALEQLRQLSYRNDNNNTVTLIRVNCMKGEKNGNRRNSYHATGKESYIPFLSVNSGDCAQFLLDNIESSQWDNTVVHLHRGSSAGIEIAA